MKKTPYWIIPLAILFCTFFAAEKAHAKEITLFNSKGEATAYIDTSDELIIYLWDGDPVAYIHDDDVYGFNGKHLGWFVDGIIWDNEGNAVGFIEGAVNMVTSIEPIKGIKSIKPMKSMREMAPMKPVFSNRWSSLPFSIFLANGIDNDGVRIFGQMLPLERQPGAMLGEALQDNFKEYNREQEIQERYFELRRIYESYGISSPDMEPPKTEAGLRLYKRLMDKRLVDQQRREQRLREQEHRRRKAARQMTEIQKYQQALMDALDFNVKTRTFHPKYPLKVVAQTSHGTTSFTLPKATIIVPVGEGVFHLYSTEGPELHVGHDPDPGVNTLACLMDAKNYQAFWNDPPSGKINLVASEKNTGKEGDKLSSHSFRALCFEDGHVIYTLDGKLFMTPRGRVSLDNKGRFYLPEKGLYLSLNNENDIVLTRIDTEASLNEER